MKLSTQGVSPKATAAAIVGAVLPLVCGVILIIVGASTSDADLKKWGYGLVIAALPAAVGAFGGAYQASPGPVTAQPDPEPR